MQINPNEPKYKFLNPNLVHKDTYYDLNSNQTVSHPVPFFVVKIGSDPILSMKNRSSMAISNTPIVPTNP